MTKNNTVNFVHFVFSALLVSVVANLSISLHVIAQTEQALDAHKPTLKNIDTVEAKSVEAKKLYHANESEGLRLLAKKWLEDEPEVASANFYLGAGLRDVSPQDALTYLQKAQKLGLKTDALMFELGQVYQLLTRYDESTIYLMRAIELMPDVKVYYKQMAMTLTLADKASQALPYFKRAVELGSKSHHTLYSYGVTAYKAGKLELSKQLLLDVIEDDPAYEGAAQTLGMIFFDQKNYKKAIDIYKAALKELPNSAELYNNMSNAQRKLRQYPQALASAQKAIELQPDYVTAYVNLAEAHIQLKDLVAARQAIAIVIDKEPATINAWVALARIEHLEKKTLARDAAMTQLESIDIEAAKAMRKRGFQLE